MVRFRSKQFRTGHTWPLTLAALLVITTPAVALSGHRSKPVAHPEARVTANVLPIEASWDSGTILRAETPADMVVYESPPTATEELDQVPLPLLSDPVAEQPWVDTLLDLNQVIPVIENVEPDATQSESNVPVEAGLDNGLLQYQSEEWSD